MKTDMADSRLAYWTCDERSRGFLVAEITPDVGMSPIIVGCVAFKKKTDTEIELNRMSVDYNFRGCGIAKVLLEKVNDLAAKLGCTSIYLVTTAPQQAAQNLYIRCGFALCSKLYLHVTPLHCIHGIKYVEMRKSLQVNLQKIPDAGDR